MQIYIKKILKMDNLYQIYKKIQTSHPLIAEKNAKLNLYRWILSDISRRE